MTITPAVLRDRDMRETILQALHRVFNANPAISITQRQVYALFARRAFSYEAHEIDGALAVMIEDRWINAVDVPCMEPMPMRGYRLNRRGRDFLVAGCPWVKIDEYSGDQAME